MKKILFFVRSLDAGGAERQLVFTAKGLAERGYSVTVLTFYTGGFYAGELLGTKVRLLNLQKKGRWDIVMFFFRLIFILRTETPDAVYSFLGLANIIAVLTRVFIPNARVVWGVRSSNMDLDNYDGVIRWSYWLECRLARFADKIIANSNAGLEYSVAQGFPMAKMVVIANGIDTEHFRPGRVAGERVRKSWKIGGGKRLIGLVGRVDPMKGHPVFLEAVALICNQLSNVHFVCVGKGGIVYESAMRKLATEMGLDDVLTWTGECSNMMGVYNALDIVSSTSSFGEGFPNVIGEAMACGVLCQVTDVGDSAMIVGRAGWVVPPNDSKALCSAWVEMLSLDARELQTTSAIARKRIESHFSVIRLLDATERVLCGK